MVVVGVVVAPDDLPVELPHAGGERNSGSAECQRCDSAGEQDTKNLARVLLVRCLGGCDDEPLASTHARWRDEHCDPCSDERDDSSDSECDLETVD